MAREALRAWEKATFGLDDELFRRVDEAMRECRVDWFLKYKRKLTKEEKAQAAAFMKARFVVDCDVGELFAEWQKHRMAM